MEKLTTKSKIISGFLIVLIIGIAIYTFIAVQKSRLPFGEKSLKGYSYLASKPNDTMTGNIIQYFWKNDTSTDCVIKEVTTTKTLENVYSGQALALNIEDLSLESWYNKKGETKYLYDTRQYTFFSNYCLKNIVQ